MRLVMAISTAALLGACGGKAVVDGGGGSSTTASSSSGTGGMTSSSSGTTTETWTTTTTTTTTTGVDCTEVCIDLFTCGLESEDALQLCPGFNPEDIDLFLWGGNDGGCVAGCQQMPALAALVNPYDCATTIEVVKGASADFACVCAYGVGAPECG